MLQSPKSKKTTAKRSANKKANAAQSGFLNVKVGDFLARNKMIIVVLAVALVGTLTLTLSRAATNTVSISGNLTTFKRSAVHSVSPTASGSLTASLTYNASKISGMTMIIRAADGSIAAQTSGSTSPLNLNAAVVPGTYQVSIQASGSWRKNASYTLNVTYPTPDATPVPAPGIWVPPVKSSFMWLLAHPLDVNNASDMGTGTKDYLGNAVADPEVYDIDGFDNPASTVTALHDRGKRAVCYLSGGSYENWRSDASTFPASVLGNNLDGWAGERWLDVRQIGVLGPIMQKRLDMCKSKGFDAVEFDNVDGYTNNTGFPLSAADQLNYDTFLANEAHARGLSVGLKNNIDQIPQLASVFDFAVNEQCNQYNECGNYSTYFVQNNKAVFNIEYDTQPSSFCPAMNSQNINAYKMPLNLDGGRVTCR